MRIFCKGSSRKFPFIGWGVPSPIDGRRFLGKIGGGGIPPCRKEKNTFFWDYHKIILIFFINSNSEIIIMLQVDAE